MKKILGSAILFFGCFSSPAEPILSPGGSLNFQSAIPFFTQSDQTPGVRYQQIYGSGDFLSHGASQYLITELAFAYHIQFPFALSSSGDGNLSNIQIDLSTSPKLPDGLSSTFSQNIGADDTVVYSGALPIVPVGTSFNFHIPLQHPFLYDATAGSLLLDVRNFQTIAPPFNGSFFLMLANNSNLDRSSSAVSFNVNSPTADLFVDTSALTTEFTVTPVPEPSAILMIVLGLGAFVGWRFRVPLMKSNLRNERSGT